MSVDLKFAQRVRLLCRDGLTVPNVARRLQCSEDDVLAALRMLGLPMPGESFEPAPKASAAEREAVKAKIPKKWQDRIDGKATRSR